MLLSSKTKKRKPLYLSKLDERLHKEIKAKATELSVSPWLVIEYLLKEATGIDGKKAKSILFKK